jgi:isoleucyl-tRNA synthetase
LAAAAVAGLDPAHVGEALKAGESVHINVNGTEHSLVEEDLLVALQPLDGYQLEREGSHAVALDLSLDEGLLLEGLAREIVHAVQAERKNSGLEVEDRINLSLGGDDRLMQAATDHREWIAGEVLALDVQIGSDAGKTEVTVDSLALRIGVERA